jgi:hypothetical protein
MGFQNMDCLASSRRPATNDDRPSRADRTLDQD